MGNDAELDKADNGSRAAAVSRDKTCERRPARDLQTVAKQHGRIRCGPGWHYLRTCFVLSVVSISLGFGEVTKDRVVLPIEVLATEGGTVSRIVTLTAEQAESVRSLWLQIHGLRYADQASVQVNASDWMQLNNNTVSIAEPGRSFGGIGGGFSTLVMSLALPNGTVISGANTIRFRFNRTDGFVSSYRVLALNFLNGDEKTILPPDTFAEDAPETWRPPLPDAASIQSGRELWQTASLTASSLPNSPRIQAHCADCHAQDGRDLKYFNFSNSSIISRSRFHGLSTLQGEQIASYIRSLPLPNPGRPWNPPYQPGPGLDEQPTSTWAAGAGLAWVLDRDTDALPFLLSQHSAQVSRGLAYPSGDTTNLRELALQISPDIFRPDGNLNAHEIPIALQLPDWSRWLPRVHPKDAWGQAFTRSEFAALYDGDTTSEIKTKVGAKLSLRALLVGSQTPNYNMRPVVTAFTQWSQARRAFVKGLVKPKIVWSPALTNKIHSTQLWQLVKTWEMMREFGLEGRGRDLFGMSAESRTWCNTVPAETSPSAVHIPDGPFGVGGSALTNEYFTASWYELQIILNSGNHRHRDRAPVDWVYIIGHFINLYAETRQPEPTRLLVAVTKALQSTDPRLGPDDLSQGWRPDQNIDPRILINPAWAPVFASLPVDVRRALTAALLTAWMDKNQQYPVAKYLPLGLPPRSYTTHPGYGDISGGKVWEAASQFRRAGVPPDVVRRLLEWGIAFTDRAARLQYD
jgi:hypothetical protein